MKKKELLNDLWYMVERCRQHIRTAERKERYSNSLADKYHYEFVADYWKEKWAYYNRYHDLLKYKAYVGTANWVSYIQRTSLDMDEFIERVDRYLDKHNRDGE